MPFSNPPTAHRSCRHLDFLDLLRATSGRAGSDRKICLAAHPLFGWIELRTRDMPGIDAHSNEDGNSRLVSYPAPPQYIIVTVHQRLGFSGSGINRMNYKLAKELYDVGFPQGGKGSWILPLDNIVARRTDRVYVPTLLELIDACGERFGYLKRGEDEHRSTFWIASTWDATAENGSTPEEAVARLWLALNNR